MAKLAVAAARILAANNCNYERDTMRSEGMFDELEAALAAVQRAIGAG